MPTAPVSLADVGREGKIGRLVSAEDAREGAPARGRVPAPRLSAEMGSAGRELARLHDEGRTFSRYEALYEHVRQAQRCLSPVSATVDTVGAALE
ncbi:hypothetical protein EG835_04635 [bacterium]|nr:hypothetical protein [bacterium]